MNKEKAISKSLANIDSDFVKALTEPARLDILKLLIVHGASDVQTLAEKMPQDRSVISRHMALMETAGLLSSQKQGRHKIYNVDGQTALKKAELLVESIRLCYQIGCC